jgi:signal transduction histidine kinase
VRTAASIVLVAVAVFLPVDARFAGAGLSRVMVVYGLHAGLAIAVLILTCTRQGARHADQLALGLVLGAIVNTLFYLVLWPRNPMLIATSLICLLMGSAVFFSWSARRVLFLAVVSCLGFALVGGLGTPDEVQAAVLVSATGALAVGGMIAVAGARILERMRANLAERQQELVALSARLMAAQEEERHRLSRELHDELGQSLTAVNAYLWLIEKDLPAELTALRGRTGDARRLVSKTLAQMRELSQLLRPSVLDDLGLVPSLDSSLKAFADRHQIATSFSADGLPERLPDAIETALYRITQEALTNVARHSEARHVRVALALEGRTLRLDIADDGHGLRARAGGGRPGTGLVGIRERVHALGGTMTVSSASGVRLSVLVPLPA